MIYLDDPKYVRQHKSKTASAFPWDEFGDIEGHPFRGNQWTDGQGSIDVYDPHDFPQATLSAFDPKIQAKIVAMTEEKTGVSYKEGATNLANLLAEAHDTPAWNEGMQWYQHNHDEAAAISERSGLPMENVVGAFAAMSPGQTWEYERPIVEAMADYHQAGVVQLSDERLGRLNESLAAKGFDPISNGTPFQEIPDSLPAVMTMKQQFDEDERGSWGIGYGYLNFDKAMRVMRGEEPDDVLGGVKVRSFYNNLMDPSSPRDVTVDVQMMQAYADDPNLVNDSKLMSSPSISAKAIGKTEIGPTPLVADAIREAADQYGILPQQAQAIMWTQWRSSFSRIEKR